MDAIFTFPAILWLPGTAAIGAVLGAVPCLLRSRRAVRDLQSRLAVCEQARQAAVERSQQARVQIGQLSKALTELTDARRARPQAEPRTAAGFDPERTLSNPLLMPRVDTPGFAPTQILPNT